MATQVVNASPSSKIAERQNAIAGALAEVEKQEEQKVEESNKTERTGTEESVKTSPTTEEKKTPVEESDKTESIETAQALELFRALKDPTKAGQIVDFLAQQAGYSKKEIAKADPKELKDDVLEIIKEEMGEEFSFLSPKLAKAIARVVDKKTEEHQKDIREKLERQEQEKLNSQAQKAQERLAKEFFDADEIPDNVAKEMGKIMDRVTPSQDTSVSDYMTDVFYAAVSKLGLTKVDKAKQDRINKNKTDAASRLAAGRNPTGTPERDTSKQLTRTEAIRLAIEQAQRESEK